MGLKETKYGKTQNSKEEKRETKDELSLISRHLNWHKITKYFEEATLELILIYKRAKEITAFRARVNQDSLAHS
jgi:hypothetical protein